MTVEETIAWLEAEAKRQSDLADRIESPISQTGWIDSTGRLVSTKTETVEHFRRVARDHLALAQKLRSEQI